MTATGVDGGAFVGFGVDGDIGVGGGASSLAVAVSGVAVVGVRTCEASVVFASFCWGGLAAAAGPKATCLFVFGKFFFWGGIVVVVSGFLLFFGNDPVNDPGLDSDTFSSFPYWDGSYGTCVLIWCLHLSNLIQDNVGSITL